MRAGEEFSELADLGSSYVGGRYGNANWSRTPGRSRMPAEAEDALGPNNSPRSHSRTRSGLYYSPPGTSYTIVERPSSGMHQHSSRDYRDYYNTTSPRGSSSKYDFCFKFSIEKKTYRHLLGLESKFQSYSKQQ